MTKKTIGIIGGMGPLATVDLYKKIIDMTRADSDREHIHIIIDNYPQIPDRTTAILQGSEAPVPFILESAERLLTAGAQLLTIPCNTSHSFYEKICVGTSLPVLNMLDITAAHLQSEGVKSVGVLATDGTKKTGVYDRALSKFGIEVIYPDDEGQKKVMHLIYHEVKAGKPANLEPICTLMEGMHALGAEKFVLGCTELPIAFCGHMNEDIIDPTQLLAMEAIKAAGYELR